MSDIKAFRNRYGISQEQLALYLGVSHSMIKMAELGKRILSTAALLKLNQLMETGSQQAAAKTGKALAKAELVKDGKSAGLVRERMQVIAGEINKLTKAVELHAGRHQQGLQKKELVQLLSAKSHVKKQESSWLRLLELDAKVAYNGYSYTQLQLRQVRLDSLLYEQERLQDLLNKK